MIQTHPLAWPEGWARTPTAQQEPGNQFTEGVDGYRRQVSFERAYALLYHELRRLSARHIVVSCNHRHGLEYRPQPGRDEGVAVYFELDGRSVAMCCDRFASAPANMSSLRLQIEAMRQLERHGGGTMRQRAFQGFEALPPPRSDWDVLGIQPGATHDEIQRAWRAKAALVHPDVEGGSTAAMAALNAARDTVLSKG